MKSEAKLSCTLAALLLELQETTGDYQTAYYG